MVSRTLTLRVQNTTHFTSSLSSTHYPYTEFVALLKLSVAHMVVLEVTIDISCIMERHTHRDLTKLRYVSHQDEV